MGQTYRHIENFNIYCYRGLKGLYLEDLNDINILTGNNNSGKTSVLELLSTVHNPGDISTWIKICRLPRNEKYYTGMLNLFPTDSDRMEISFSYIDASSEYQYTKLSAWVEEVLVSEKDIDEINGHETRDAYKKGADFLEAKCLKLKIEGGSYIFNSYSLFDFQTRVPMVKSLPRWISAVYVAPGAHTDGKILLDEVMESPALYQEMMKILHEFDDSIINITKSGNGAEYMILSCKQPKAIPLSAYGDGMKKALAILAAVVKAKDGILLLDEFETAIHTSAMNHIFSWILQSAQKLNVQVFLSSHSLEAIGKVLRCDSALQDKINLYTLYNKEGKNLVRKMNCAEAIKAQDDWGVELR